MANDPPSGLKATNPTIGIVISVRSACTAWCRRSSNSGRIVPSTRWVVSIASKDSKMLSSGSVSRLAAAAAPSSRAKDSRNCSSAICLSSSARRAKDTAVIVNPIAINNPRTRPPTNCLRRRFALRSRWAFSCCRMRSVAARASRAEILEFRKSCSSGVKTSWAFVVQVSKRANLAPRKRKLSSLSASSHSFVTRINCLCRFRSAALSSSQPRSRSQTCNMASWANSTVGWRVAGSWSRVNRR